MKRLLAVVFVVLLVTVGLLVYAHIAKVWPFSVKENTTSSTPTGTDSTINYSPPTEQEIQEGQEAKKHLKEEQEEAPQNPTTKSPANVGISFADVEQGNVEIRAFTTSVIEGSGKCTATLTLGSQRITKTSAGFIDSSSTLCRPIYIPVASLEKGTWSVRVAYTSPTHTGSSEAVEVTIQ